MENGTHVIEAEGGICETHIGKARITQKPGEIFLGLVFAFYSIFLTPLLAIAILIVDYYAFSIFTKSAIVLVSSSFLTYIFLFNKYGLRLLNWLIFKVRKVDF